MIVIAVPSTSRSPRRQRRPSVKELDAELSAPRPPNAPPAVTESPLPKGDIPLEASESVQLPGRDAGFLQLRIVPDDNSCLFSAVGVVFEGGIEAAPKLRQGKAQREDKATRATVTLTTVVADAIRADPDNYSDVMLGCVSRSALFVS